MGHLAFLYIKSKGLSNEINLPLNNTIMKKHFIFLVLSLITASWCRAQNPILWGLTASGGSASGFGTIFKYNSATGKETVVHDFGNNNTSGGGPQGSLIKGSDGLLYEMCEGGGHLGMGTLNSYNIATGKGTLLFDFGIDTAREGSNPTGSLIQASNGLLYGVTNSGGSSGVYGAGNLI